MIICLGFHWALIWFFAFANAELRPRQQSRISIGSSPNTCDVETTFDGSEVELRRNTQRSGDNGLNKFWELWSGLKSVPETPPHSCPPKILSSTSSKSRTSLLASSMQGLSRPQVTSLSSLVSTATQSIPQSTSISSLSSQRSSNSNISGNLTIATVITPSYIVSKSQNPTSGRSLAISAPSPSPKRPPHNDPTPVICKTTVGDALWPQHDIWKSYLPNVTVIPFQGSEAHPNYFLAAKSVADVQSAISFTTKYNIRLSIISSGLDYLGRNDAPNGLLLSVKYLKGVKVLEDVEVKEEGFEEVKFGDDPSLANSVSWKTRRRYAVSVGAGVTTQELNDALEPSNLVATAAAHGSISVAGGWLQGGGHGPFSFHKLGVDEVLEFQVVTGDGRLRIANQLMNQDLFWALKGGGGSTFGVVIQATLNVWPDTSRVMFSAWLNTTSSAPADSIYSVAQHCFEEIATLTYAFQGYCFIYPRAIRMMAWTHPNGLNEERPWMRSYRRNWMKTISKLQKVQHVASVIHEEIYYGSFKEFYDGTFGMMNQNLFQPEDKCKRKLEWHPYDYECKEGIIRRSGSSSSDTKPSPAARNVMDPRPNGITKVDSWLLTKEHFFHRSFTKVLKASMPRYDNDALMEDVPLRISFTYNSSAVDTRVDSSVHPAWRRAIALVSGTNLTALKTFAPNMAAYLNEASIPQPDFKKNFWGNNYNKLLQIKRKYDPEGMFYVTPGIGADEWFVDASRLCRHIRNPNTTEELPVAPSPEEIEPIIIDPGMDINTSATSITTHQVNNLTSTPSLSKTFLNPLANSTTALKPSDTLSLMKTSLTSSTAAVTNKSARSTTKASSSNLGFPNTRPIPTIDPSSTTTAPPQSLPSPEGDNTNINTIPLAQFLLPGPFATPWPINQVSADSFQHGAASRLSSMRQSSARERGRQESSYFGFSTTTIYGTSLVSVNLTPKMPAWTPQSKSTSVHSESISLGVQFTTVPWINTPSVSFIPTTSSISTSKSTSTSPKSILSTTTGKPGVTSVSGPGARPAPRINP